MYVFIAQDRTHKVVEVRSPGWLLGHSSIEPFTELAKFMADIRSKTDNRSLDGFTFTVWHNGKKVHLV